MTVNDYAIIFCKNIRFLRKQKGLSMREMAKIMGVSVYTLKKIENDEVPPRLDVGVLFRIQNSYGIKCKELVGDAPLEEITDKNI